MSSIPIPDEVLSDILLRLPPKSIKICARVCKHLNAVISNPNFVKSYHALENRDLSFIVVNVTRFTDEDDEVDEEDWDDYGVTDDFSIIRITTKDSLLSYKADPECNCKSANPLCECERICDTGSLVDDYPLHRDLGSLDDVSIMGVCDGVICLLISERRVEEKTICFWNPATKQYKRLTNPPGQFSNDIKIVRDYSAYGFYHNSNDEDYKLIKIVAVSGGSRRRRLGVQIYSLNSNLWENSQKFTSYLSSSLYRNIGVLVNESLHWLLKTPENTARNVILSFSTCDEGFGNVALPQAVENKNVTKELGRLDDSLCLLVQSESRRDGADLWVMQEYGVKQSWTKLFTINEENIFMSNGMPVCTLKNGEILMQSPKGFVLYDPTRDKAKLVTIRQISGGGKFWQVESYMHSFVSLGSRTYVGQ